MHSSFLLALCVLSVSAAKADADAAAANKPDFTVSSTVPSTFKVLAKLTKSIDVFGFPIVASSSLPDAQLKHAAAMLAEYLDNDADGCPDDVNVMRALGTPQVRNDPNDPNPPDPNDTNCAGLFVGANEADGNAVRGSGSPDKDDGYRAYNGLQELYGTEMKPACTAATTNECFDASIEEILHVVTKRGMGVAYMSKWDEADGSTVALEMDKMRGGKHTTIPSPYPSSAGYTYTDASCDYGCQVRMNEMRGVVLCFPPILLY